VTTERPSGAEPPDSADLPGTAVDEGSGLRLLVARSRERVSAGQVRAAALLEKYGDRPLLDVGLRIYQRDRESAGTIVGSALAFRLFLFFVPLLLFVVGLLGFVADLVSDVDPDDVGISGGLASQINAALTQPNSTRWIAVLVGLVGMLTTGRSLSKGMVSASCLAWRLPVRTKASPRVIAAVVGLVFGIAVVSTIVNRVRAELGVAVAGMSFLVAFAIYAVAWLLLSMLLPRATNDPGALLPGAVLVGATLVVMQAISQLYLPDRLDRASQLYGAIGTTIVTLGWFFFLGRAIVLGMAVDAVIYERFGSISQFVFSLPLLRALPRRWPWIRRFFGLDP
jgi:uncharacterized BrkB/YihY/UPF0761 family membrane protein